MSILVKGIKMPTCCEECAFIRTVGLDRWKCELSGCDFNSWDVGWGDGTENKYIRHSSCPLVEVPPHGRLIDADALDVIGYCGIPQGREDTFDDGVMWLAEQIDLLPTIIPAEGYSERELQRDYEASVEYAQYCERYEPTYDPDTGAM